jgi:lipoate-protein ligase A
LECGNPADAGPLCKTPTESETSEFNLSLLICKQKQMSPVRVASLASGRLSMWRLRRYQLTGCDCECFREQAVTLLLDMTKTVFSALDVYHERDSSRSAALNMAVDEALLEVVNVPTIRFYRWDHPAVSFGYFGKFSEVEAAGNDVVRRWTGGGIVHHGEDLTYSLVIPASDAAFAESSPTIYERVHEAICAALRATGHGAVVAAIAGRGAGISDAGYNCFANPVRADVLLGGRKIAGAAQRRTRRGLLHQGSIQGIQLPADLAPHFADRLANESRTRSIESSILERADTLAAQKYGTEAWLRRR